MFFSLAELKLMAVLQIYIYFIKIFKNQWNK